jgi:uncharacterized protein (DUF1330 family)
MTAYWINTFREVRDPERLARYAALAGDVMRDHGGRFLARGLPQHAFELGSIERTTLIEFPSVEAAAGAYRSAEYQQALAVLGDAADRDIRIIAAVDDPPAPAGGAPRA